VLEEKSISQLLRRKKGSYSGNYHRQRFNPAIVRGNFFRFCKPPYEKARVTSVCPTQRAIDWESTVRGRFEFAAPARPELAVRGSRALIRLVALSPESILLGQHGGRELGQHHIGRASLS
jgi:hypothetical protein